MQFTLEDLVTIDMIFYGYDPDDPLDIDAYWESRLS